MVVNNKKDWFTERVHLYEVAMYRLAYGMLRNEEDAGDAVQEALLTAYVHLESLKDEKKFKSWIMRITANASVDILRKRKDTLSIDEYDVPTGDDGAREEKMDLWNAVCSLQEEYRTVVILFYYEQMSIKDICRILNMKQANVKTRLARGRGKLRVILQSEVNGDEHDG